MYLSENKDKSIKTLSTFSSN